MKYIGQSSDKLSIGDYTLSIGKLGEKWFDSAINWTAFNISAISHGPV